MSCSTGTQHTITLANGLLYAFGDNEFGQLGLEKNNNNDENDDDIDDIEEYPMAESITIPTQIPNLPKIKMVSCGCNFTGCVDEEGFLWTFGDNEAGQLGSELIANFHIPQKIEDIPPVQSVSCGGDHILILTTDGDLWSCGSNLAGQLCFNKKLKGICFDDEIYVDEENDEENYEDDDENDGEDDEDIYGSLTPKQTPFSDISKISAGGSHSFFQNSKGEIFGCGANESGQLGLGHFNSSQYEVCQIQNQPPNIVEFCCGGAHSLFLDADGKVFSVGNNELNQLGLGDDTNRNTLTQIQNIPPIQTISCVNNSSYLLDFDGNVWSFGDNENRQLGLEDDSPLIAVPTKIPTLKDIKQISSGYGELFFAKDSQNKLFVAGDPKGLLGIGTVELWTYEEEPGTEFFIGKKNHVDPITIPTEINPEYSNIWGDCTTKSARK